MAYPCFDMPDAITPAPAEAKPAPAAPAAHDAPSETDVYAIHGADPEVLAYAMAKYSRSSLSMRESLAEISSQRAEQFLNTFYFQYGHRSIADLAHIPFAVERLSLLAAIALVDEQRWDGQERSTRYQNFRKSGWYTPVLAPEQRRAYTAGVEALFAAYDAVGAGMTEALKRAIPQPEGMKDDAYLRTLKARAFDVARYLLPLATNTSLGQIVSARTLESQISRLLSLERIRRGARPGREAPRRRRRPRLERASRRSASPLQRGLFRRRRLRRARLQHPASRGQDRAHAGQIRRAQRLRDRHQSRPARRGGRRDGRAAH